MNKIKLRSKQFLSMRCKFAYPHHRMIFSFSINALNFLFKVTRPAVYPSLPLNYTIKRKKKPNYHALSECWFTIWLLLFGRRFFFLVNKGRLSYSPHQHLSNYSFVHLLRPRIWPMTEKIIFYLNSSVSIQFNPILNAVIWLDHSYWSPLFLRKHEQFCAFHIRILDCIYGFHDVWWRWVANWLSFSILGLVCV